MSLADTIKGASRAHRLGAAAIVLGLLALPLSPLAPAIPLALFVVVCLAAPLFPSWSFFLPTRHRGSTTRRQVALTFDDGPDRALLEPLLELLRREGVKSTFFVVGQRVAAWPEAIGKLVSDGHAIGNHSWSHDPFLMLRSPLRLEREIAHCQTVLAQNGVAPLAFRPPIGITNPRLPAVLAKLGMKCVTFRIRPADFRNSRFEGLADRILCRAGPGDILLIHEVDPGDRKRTAFLGEIAKLIAGLRSAGLEITPLEQVLGEPVMGEAPALAGSPPQPFQGDNMPESARTRPPPGPGGTRLRLRSRLKPAGAKPKPTTLRGLGSPPLVERADSPNAFAVFAAALSAILFIAYPALAYFAITFLGARTAAAILLGALAISRLRRPIGNKSALSGLRGLGILVAGLLLLATLLDDPLYLLAYPSLVSAVLLAQFAWSLRSSAPMVERFARLQADDLTPAEIAYCRAITRVWCAFFAVNGTIATYLAAWASRETWAFYTGLVSYLLMGLLFAIEYAIRKARFGRFGTGLHDRILFRLLWRGHPP